MWAWQTRSGPILDPHWQLVSTSLIPQNKRPFLVPFPSFLPQLQVDNIQPLLVEQTPVQPLAIGS